MPSPFAHFLSLSSAPSPLPFRLLTLQKRLQNRHLGLQTVQPNLHLPRNLLLITAQLGIEVFSVRRRGHGGAENRLNQKAVVGFEGCAVGIAERDAEFIGGGEVFGDSEGGEFQATAMGKYVSWVDSIDMGLGELGHGEAKGRRRVQRTGQAILGLLLQCVSLS
jgi:hypothetical protein